MAKKQKSFADKASGNQNKDSVFVKYVKSTKSEETGGWRFNEQIVQMQKGEQLDTALRRLDEVAKLVDIDLSQFSNSETVESEKSESDAEAVSTPTIKVEETRPKDEVMFQTSDTKYQEEE
tara:strand:- start:1051 stop:1413 length:363 start_codon:yes stop_codon:yes gene_type:complete